MGSGIAQVCAMNGLEVILFDVSETILAAAKQRIIAGIDSLILKKKITGGEDILNRILFTSSIDHCRADVIIEAIIENATAKADLLNRLAAINHPSTVFATNTSSLSVTEIASQFGMPGQLVGMHFFNPPVVMKLVEVVTTKYAAPRTVDTIARLAERMGKTAVICKDSPGFIVNRVARPYYLEALHLVEKSGIDIELVDELMESAGFKMGPFRLMDLIGNDINYSVSCIVYDALGKPERLKPSSIQKEMVDGGLLGRKTGRGYYAYHD